MFSIFLHMTVVRVTESSLYVDLFGGIICVRPTPVRIYRVYQLYDIPLLV